MKKFVIAAAVFCIVLPLAAQNMPADEAPGSAGVYSNSTESTDAAGPAGTGEAARISFFLETAIQYADEGEYEDAERAYLRALEKDPEDAEIRYRLSILYMLMHRYKEAEPLMKKLHEDFPDSFVALNNLAWLYATGGEIKNSSNALRYARGALVIEPSSPSVWNTLAESYYLAGHYDKALRASEEALELLRIENAEEEKQRVYALQYIKIKRAQEAFDLIKETGGE